VILPVFLLFCVLTCTLFIQQDFVYSVTGSCLSFIAFALLAVFCAYPEVWREHLFGGLYWRNVSNFVIIAAAVGGGEPCILGLQFSIFFLFVQFAREIA
jgi:hypothetical protein